MNFRQAAKIVALYRNISLIDKLHIYIRLRRSYFEIVEKYVPKKGNILDFGCGHGFFSLYLEEESKQRKIIGIDISSKKIKIANSSIHDKKNIFLVDKNSNILDKNNYFDCIAVLNVLYLFKSDEQKVVLEKLINSLKENGVLIIREPDSDLKIHAFITKLREYIMINVLRLTSGEDILFRSKKWWLRYLSEYFLSVKSIDLSQNKFHQLYICKKKKRWE